MTNNIKVVLNNEKNGVELYFDGVPDKEIREELKENSFKWSRFQKCWYTKQTEKALKYAQSLSNTELKIEKTSKVKTSKAKKNKVTLSLYDRLNENLVTGEGQL